MIDKNDCDTPFDRLANQPIKSCGERQIPFGERITFLWMGFTLSILFLKPEGLAHR